MNTTTINIDDLDEDLSLDAGSYIPGPVRIDEELDSTVAEQLGDDILVEVASAEKVQKVEGTGRRTGAIQSHQARAWTAGGNVD